MATATPHLDQLIATCQQIQAQGAATEYANAFAIGVFEDEPENPTLGAIVYQGKIFHLSVHDCYAHLVAAGELTWNDVQTLVMGTIIVAIVTWQKELERLHQVATDYITSTGEVDYVLRLAENPDNASEDERRVIERGA